MAKGSNKKKKKNSHHKKDQQNKESSQNVDHSQGQEKKETKLNMQPRIFIIVRKIQFTFLEDCIIKIIEKLNGAASDEEISDILCLSPEDISTIVADYGLKDRLEGDKSRRTFKDGWEKKEMALVREKKENDKKEYSYYKVRKKEKNDKNKVREEEKNDKNFELENMKKDIATDEPDWKSEKFYQDCSSASLKILSKYDRLQPKDIPKKLKNERAEAIYIFKP